jgi:hypothetical protein
LFFKGVVYVRHLFNYQSISVGSHTSCKSSWKKHDLILKGSHPCVPFVFIEYQLHQLHWQVIWLLLSDQTYSTRTS